MAMEIDAMESLKRLERTIDETIEAAEKRGLMTGEVAGACKVIKMLNLNKKKSVELLCNAIGINEASGKKFYNEYIAKK